MIRRPPRSTQSRSSAASDVYKRQCQGPIAITNTHAVGIAHAGIIAWMNRYHPELTDVWLLPVAAETWDGYLNDINGHHVNEDTVIQALQEATSDQPDEG